MKTQSEIIKNPVLIAGLSILALATPVHADDARDQRKEARNQPTSFALIGDVPYSEEQVPKFDNLIRQVNRDSSIEWVLHAGDIKGGSTFCDDETLQARFDQYQKFSAAFIYTPGDNEWTDCHRDAAGNYNPLGRLELLRQIFYPQPGYTTGGKQLAVQTQASDPAFEEFVENQLWFKSRVVFAAIHVIGSDNNLNPWNSPGFDPTDSRESPRTDRIDEFNRREQANLAWLEKTFATATQRHSRGVFILIHGDPAIDSGDTQLEGFKSFIDALRQYTAAFDGQVVLAHGDSHFFRIDKLLRAPVAGQPGRTTRLENFTRVETFGTEDVHWIKVTADPMTKNVFSFEPVTVEVNRFPR